MTESQPSLRSRPGIVRTEDIQTVSELRAVLALVPGDTLCGPYVAEWSRTGDRFALYPTDDEND